MLYCRKRYWELISIENKKPFTLRAILMLVVLGLAYFFSNFHRLSLSVIGDVIAADYGLSSAQLATLSSAIFYSYALTQVPCGAIADRTSAKKLVAFSCILAAASTIWFSCAGSFGGLTAARILTGIAVALVYVPAMAAIRVQFGDRIYGTMAGIMTAMGQIGSVCAAAPLRLLTDLFSWQTTFFIIGVISVFLTVASWFLIIDPKKAAPAAAVPAKKSSLKGALSLGGIALTVFFFIQGGTHFSFQSLWGTQYFTQALQESTAAAGLYLMLGSVGSIFGSLFMGWVADRIGNIRALVLLTALRTVLWGIFAVLSPGLSPALLWVLCLFTGFTGSGGLTVGFGCIRLFADQNSTGIVTGINNCLLFLGSAVFTQLNGMLMSLSPMQGVDGQYSFLMLVFLVLTLVSALFLGLANRKRFTE